MRFGRLGFCASHLLPTLRMIQYWSSILFATPSKTFPSQAYFPLPQFKSTNGFRLCVSTWYNKSYTNLQNGGLRPVHRLQQGTDNRERKTIARVQEVRLQSRTVSLPLCSAFPYSACRKIPKDPKNSNFKRVLFPTRRKCRSRQCTASSKWKRTATWL